MDLCIIIPAYNAKNTIGITLESIKQQKLPISYEVIIVNDCSDYNYEEYITKYKDYYNIREIKTKINSGPGVARQLGIDNSDSEYLVFIDSDDYFYEDNSIMKMYDTIKKDDSDLLIASFITKTGFIDKKMIRDLIWLHGKMYKRDFLKKFNIRFNDSRANEDNGFNRLIIFMKPKYVFLDENVYVYNLNTDSITRRNNKLFEFTGIEGFCYNMAWAVKEAILRGRKKSEFKVFLADTLITLYIYYMKFKDKYEVDKILKWGLELYSMYNEIKEPNDNELYYKIIEGKRYEYTYTLSDPIISFEDFLNMFDFDKKSM